MEKEYYIIYSRKNEGEMPTVFGKFMTQKEIAKLLSDPKNELQSVSASESNDEN